MRCAQALGFLEDARKGVFAGHLFPLERDLVFSSPGGGA
jgi:hypothetical protein